MKRVSVIYLLLFLLTACGGNHRSAFLTEGLDTLYTPSHATGFMIYSLGESSLISVFNPWQGAYDVEKQLFLSRNGEPTPEGFTGTAVEIPLKKVVCMSSSYIALIDELGETDAIKGVSGARYLANAEIGRRYAEGDVRDVGYDAHMNYELLASLNPDLVMIYGIAGENSQLTAKLDELGIKHIYIGDYVEQSPLGKAEWLVAFGEMFDKRTLAEEIFAGICERYEITKMSVANAVEEDRPVVMLNAPYRDTWYVPGDRSYMVRLIEDAGGVYACAGVDSDTSRPISGESAYIFASDSDIWLNPGQATSLNEVRSMNPKFADIPAILNERVYNNNARVTDGGGSDFWESGAARPDIVLMDMAKIFYPELFPDHEFYYFKRLK